MMSGNKIINNPEYITELMSLREKNGANPYFRIGEGCRSQTMRLFFFISTPIDIGTAETQTVR
ncbi:hypothetical protein Pcaca04_31790 [Pectobacterium carotovorum subsp. carotovorum]|nr:hypothetical protein Pcaca04_31790 [Pectobacterium carotovorum subsp. carotovorum]